MPEDIDIKLQRIKADGLGPCCTQSWAVQLKDVITRGSTKMVCTYCKTRMVLHRPSNWWYHESHPRVKEQDSLPGKEGD